MRYIYQNIFYFSPYLGVVKYRILGLSIGKDMWYVYNSRSPSHVKGKYMHRYIFELALACYFSKTTSPDVLISLNSVSFLN